MTDIPIDPYGNDWSPAAMAARLDNIGSLSDDDAATLDRIALELRAASVVAPIAAAVAQPVTLRLMPNIPNVYAIGGVLEMVQAVQDTAKADGWPMDKYRSAMAAALAPVPEVFRVGPLTMDEVFKPAGLTNLSNLQAVLDAVEKALSRV